MPATEQTIEDQRAKAGFHFREDIAPGLVLEMPLHRILHSSQSEFQQVDVIDSYFGRTLVTDGKTQSAQVSFGDSLASAKSFFESPSYLLLKSLTSSLTTNPWCILQS